MIVPKQERTTKSQKNSKKSKKKRRIKRNSGNITNQRTAATASKEKLHEWHLTCQTGDVAESWMGTGCRELELEPETGQRLSGNCYSYNFNAQRMCMLVTPSPIPLQTSHTA